MQKKDAALAAKRQAQENTRAMAQERDETFKLLEQSEWDFAIQEEELNLALECLSDTSFVFEKEQHGRSKRWSLRIVRLVIKLLVCSTAPASVSDAVVAFVKNFAPQIKLHELPSLSFVQRF